jgi:hypothetical protein
MNRLGELVEVWIIHIERVDVIGDAFDGLAGALFVKYVSNVSPRDGESTSTAGRQTAKCELPPFLALA